MSKLIEQLKRHEGFRAKPYKDTEGFTTIGYGFNLDAGIDEDLAVVILNYQVDKVKADVFSMQFVCKLNDARCDVIVNMAFNLGVSGLMKFKKMIAAIERGHYGQAAYEMMDSKWAVQVGNRAIELSEQMRTGEYA